MIGENAALPDVYLDRSISDVSADAANTAVETAVTLTLPSWDAWRFGDVDFGGGDGAADYPVLRRAEDLWPGAQAVALADYQTRLLRADGEPLRSELLLAGDTTLRLDANGGASAGQAPAPRCESDGRGGARVFTNYNNVTILLGVAAGGTLSVKENCEFEIGLRRNALFVVDEILLTLTFMSGEESKTRVHTFFSLAGAGADFWLRDSDGDGTINAYDWTPLSDDGPDLRGDADGSAARPWPIYNIWHLQAIDGISVAANGTMALNFPLFGGGGGDALTMHYRVMTEINALATRDWGRNLTGFNPIGDNGSPFIGVLDGGGREARYLYVNADGGGLFGVVGGSVSRFGLSEMDIRGRDVGGLAATVTGLVSLVWGTGRVGVDESDGGGGLVAAVSGGDVRESWFVGEINGGGGIGGLVGRLSGGVGAQVGDSWAMARVSDVDGGNESGVGGLIGWSEGDAICATVGRGVRRWRTRERAAWSAGTRARVTPSAATSRILISRLRSSMLRGSMMF